MNYTIPNNILYFFLKKKWLEILSYKNIDSIDLKKISNYEKKINSKERLKLWNIYKRNTLYKYIKINSVEKKSQSFVENITKIIESLNIELTSNEKETIIGWKTYNLIELRAVKNIIVPFKQADKKEKCNFVIENIKCYEIKNDNCETDGRFDIVKGFNNIQIVAFGMLYFTSLRLIFWNNFDNNFNLSNSFSIFYNDIHEIHFKKDNVIIHTKDKKYLLLFSYDASYLILEYLKIIITKYEIKNINMLF